MNRVNQNTMNIGNNNNNQNGIVDFKQCYEETYKLNKQLNVYLQEAVEQNKKLNSENSILHNELNELNEKYCELSESVEPLKKANKQLKENIDTLQSDLDEKQRLIEEYINQIENKEEKEEKERTIKELRKKQNERMKEITKLNKIIEEQNETIENLKKEKQKLEENSIKQDKLINILQVENTKHTKTNINRNKIITELKNQNEQLQQKLNDRDKLNAIRMFMMRPEVFCVTEPVDKYFRDTFEVNHNEVNRIQFTLDYFSFLQTKEKLSYEIFRINMIGNHPTIFLLLDCSVVLAIYGSDNPIQKRNGYSTDNEFFVAQLMYYGELQIVKFKPKQNIAYNTNYYPDNNNSNNNNNNNQGEPLLGIGGLFDIYSDMTVHFMNYAVGNYTVEGNNRCEDDIAKQVYLHPIQNTDNPHVARILKMVIVNWN